MSAIPKALHLPPSGRPRWVCPESAQLDLLYLAWGHRFYGQHSIPLSRHPGWHYILVKRGRPTLVFEHHRKALNPGDLLVIDPDCASGWMDRSDGVSELLVWIWRTGPRCWDLTVGPGKYRQWTIGARLRRELEDFHTLCREEVERPDELTPLAIKQLHLAIDIAVARLVRSKTQPPEPSVRMELALRWMAQNLTENNLTSALCEYLNISPATLTRMFQRQHGESPFVHHQRLRMERARELLKSDGWSVAEVASALGYKDPNDFRQVFRRFVGKSPRIVRRTTARHH